jgi:C-terminal processing protease CtpA/Prc
MKKSFGACAFLAFVIWCFSSASSSVSAQQPPSKFEIERAHTMLGVIKEDLKKNYYDPTYHGMDLETSFKTADEKLKTATSVGQLFGVIAKVLADLDDSHTFFIPPGRAARTEYGWQGQMIGDKCYVVAVKPGSDAELKGMKAGDQVVAVDGARLTRQNMWTFQYLYHVLRPQSGMRLHLLKPDGAEQEIAVLARIQPRKRIVDVSGDDDTGNDIFDLVREEENESHLRRHRYLELGDDLLIWKMPAFDLEKEKVDEMADRFRKRKALILDLRGNGGGAEETLLRLLGNLFDRDVKVGDLKARKDAKPVVAKSRGNSFTGKLVVLIDSESGSASEVFARVVQLEKRGTVIGDLSSGAVMRARHFPHEIGIEVIVPYGVSITEADIVMGDGKSLERVGVKPDEIKLPTAADLAAQRDPVLAYAASLAGITITPEKAGSFFPIEWRK